MQKYDEQVEKLIAFLEDKRPPGLLVGLSGTDSIVAFSICYKAMKWLDMADRVWGIHYTDVARRSPDWFDTFIRLWIVDKHPETRYFSTVPFIKNTDELRWAHMHEFAKTNDLWTVGSINATELYLGKYSQFANTCSLQVVQSLYKTDILNICEYLEVPTMAIRKSRTADPACGRDEIMAARIELIDKIIQEFKLERPFTDSLAALHGEDQQLVYELMGYVYNLMEENAFKKELPYVI